LLFKHLIYNFIKNKKRPEKDANIKKEEV